MGGVFSAQDAPTQQFAQQPARFAPQAAQPSQQAVRSVQAPVRSAQASVRPSPSPQAVQITSAARTALREHEAKLANLVEGLCPEGRAVYQALQATISLAAHDEVPHFESAFRKKLEQSIGSGIELERIASGQWKCSYRGEEFVVSVRTEVLGASLNDSFDLLSALKCQARTAKSMLLVDSAQWMRKLSKGCDKREFLSACRCAPDKRGNACRLQQPGLDWDDDMCPFCEKPESSSRMAGRHMCHVKAMFRCPQCRSKWSSAQARFSPEEERVLGQKCQNCEQTGDLLDWSFSDAPDGGNQGRDHERKPHRSDLCEACGSFGNCQGAFFEPFIMSSAIALLTKECATTWANSGDILVANAGLHSVAMLPHISSASDVQSPFAQGGSSMASKGSGKGKANAKSPQRQHFGGKEDRDAMKGKGKGRGKSSGKGKGGQACRMWRAGNCSYGDRCHFLHD